MELQTVLVLVIVAMAATFAARRAWKAMVAARAPKSGCGSDCGCGH
jgi:hypothetical protein